MGQHKTWRMNDLRAHLSKLANIEPEPKVQLPGSGDLSGPTLTGRTGRITMIGALMRLSAAILAGGLSTRMGRDKALIPLPPEGRPMIEAVTKRLREVADDVFFVANDERLAGFGVRTAPDAYPGAGTLGGIHAALSASWHDHCLVVACDMPFLNADLLKYMASIERSYDVLAPVTAGVSRQGGGGVIYQTLHAIYAKRCIEAIEVRLEAGDNRVIGFFEQVSVQTIGEDECRTWDPELRSFLNLNTPESLAAAIATVT